MVTRTRSTPPVAMSVAGSDSGGGAGIAADLRAFAALGVQGTIAIAAVTAQSTTEVRRSWPLSPEQIAEQVRTVADDLPLAAAKTGMLATSANVAMVAELVRDGVLPPPVVDPVLVASSGAALLDEDAIDTYRRVLLPVAAACTPNLPEAERLSGLAIASLDDAFRAARAIVTLGPAVVVVKGGHRSLDPARPDLAVDAAIIDGVERVLSSPRVDTQNNHGTGCTFSAALAGARALGLDWLSALETAKRFVTEAVLGAASWKLGHGHGPLDQLAWCRLDESAGTTGAVPDAGSR
jgi:hydroxymethylpyrimidine/phosphomethylpyrimidine kinase